MEQGQGWGTQGRSRKEVLASPEATKAPSPPWP